MKRNWDTSYLKVPTRCETCGTWQHTVKDVYSHVCIAPPADPEQEERDRQARNAVTLATMRAREQGDRHVATVEAQASIANYAAQRFAQWSGKDFPRYGIVILNLPMYGGLSGWVRRHGH